MKTLIIISWIYIGIIVLALLVYWLRKSVIVNWLINSLNYPFRKHRIDKLFKSLPDTQRRDLWLESVLIEDNSKWYYRALEKFIREKYIEPIVSEYGSI